MKRSSTIAAPMMLALAVACAAPVPRDAEQLFAAARQRVGVPEEPGIGLRTLATFHDSTSEYLVRVHSTPDHRTEVAWEFADGAWRWMYCWAIGDSGLQGVVRSSSEELSGASQEQILAARDLELHWLALYPSTRCEIEGQPRVVQFLGGDALEVPLRDETGSEVSWICRSDFRPAGLRLDTQTSAPSEVEFRDWGSLGDMEVFRGAAITSGGRVVEMTFDELLFDAPLDSLFPVDGEWNPWAN